LRFFNADPEDYDLVFVSNASAAIKLTGEIFRDYMESISKSTGKKNKGFWFGYQRDVHNSIIGIREFTEGNYMCFPTDEAVESWIENPTGKPEFWLLYLLELM
jgi:molybdenum cofactor sulfurtransferase